MSQYKVIIKEEAQAGIFALEERDAPSVTDVSVGDFLGHLHAERYLSLF